MHVLRATDNLRIYNAPEVALHYAALDYLTPCEHLLFSTYIKPNAAILDMAVGGGRTTPYLSRAASRYVGVDYSEEMVRVCRTKFPQWQFVVRDASDLSAFADASFDAIVMAFNGLDYVLPQERRWQCLRECRRVLREGGVLIFSSHNPRAVLVRPAWDREKLRVLAHRLAGEKRVWFLSALFVLTVVKSTHAFLCAAAASTIRLGRRGTRSAFWRGEGCLLDPAHGGLVTHCWVPERAVAEVTGFEFRLATLLGDDYPSRSGTFVTDWYYYVFRKVNHRAGGESCE